MKKKSVRIFQFLVRWLILENFLRISFQELTFMKEKVKNPHTLAKFGARAECECKLKIHFHFPLCKCKSHLHTHFWNSAWSRHHSTYTRKFLHFTLAKWRWFFSSALFPYPWLSFHIFNLKISPENIDDIKKGSDPFLFLSIRGIQKCNKKRNLRLDPNRAGYS